MPVALENGPSPQPADVPLGTLLAVLEGLPVSTFVLDGEGFFCNAAAERLTGYHRSDLAILRSSLCTDNPPSEPRDCTITRKDGTELILHITPARSGAERLILTAQDVTGQRRLERSEQKIMEREALLDALVDSVPFDFFALDDCGRYTVVSSATRQTWGDPVGKTVADFCAGTALERYVPRWLENNSRALAGEVLEGECVYEWGGEQHVVHEMIGPIRDRQQRIIGTFGINRDISQQKRTQQALAESEDRYRCLSGLLSDYVYCCIRRGEGSYRLQWLCGAITDITGFSETEISGRGCWLSLVHPDDRDRVLARVLGLRPGDRCTDEFRLVTKSGEICWVRESLRCEAGESEGELRLYGAAQNITASKQAENALKNVEQIFHLFLEHSPAYLVFKDEQQKVIRLSSNFEELLGRPVAELIGKRAGDVFPPEVAERTLQEDLAVLRDGKPIQYEEKLDGRYYSSLKFAIPQKDRPPLIAAIKTDITARKEAEDAVCQLNEVLDKRVKERTAQLETAILEQESFSYSVSHDLRAPLRHINSFSAILLEDYSGILPDEGREYLERICRATRRMGTLIDNLLKLSQVSRTIIKRTPVNLSELATEILRSLQEIEPERSVETVITPHLYASCDKPLVRQLFENLLGNAWKYTAKVPAARIEFGMTASDKGPVFHIRDNGAGFDMGYQDRLFVPFQRLHGSEFEGNGIGLATTQRIVQRHGGSIWAEGAVGKGAEFYFTLPM